MTCEEFQAHLTAFGLGELKGAEAATAREHVARCSPCASSALRDRQLTGLLRTSVVPTPPELHDTVVAALRAEAASDARNRNRQRGWRSSLQLRWGRKWRRPRLESRARHWGALGLAAASAAVVTAVLLLALPTPNPDSTLTAAWTAYRSGTSLAGGDTHRLPATFGSAASNPDLRSLGLQAVGTGARRIDSHLMAISEYRDQAGKRVTLMRWKGKLPRRYGTDQEVQTASWGQSASVWWLENGVVYCAIGEVNQQTLMAVSNHLLGDHARGES